MLKKRQVFLSFSRCLGELNWTLDRMICKRVIYQLLYRRWQVIKVASWQVDLTSTQTSKEATDASIKESLLKGKDQYSLPPCTNEFGSTAFRTDQNIFLIYETSYLNEDVNRIEPSPSVRVPFFNVFFLSFVKIKFHCHQRFLTDGHFSTDLRIKTMIISTKKFWS